jgi:ABC-type hemin transport system substrate-binding protein
MRICSFIPSATEIVYLLNQEDNLFGVTHECDFPHDAINKPNVVKKFSIILKTQLAKRLMKLFLKD